MIYLLDTNILLAYLRQAKITNLIDRELNLFNPDNTLLISIVNIAELKSIAFQNNWGITRIKLMEDFLSNFLVVNINSENIINAYAEIDAFSQNKLEKIPLNMSARNMGKNDIWIAATSHVLNAALVSMDSDFQHLNGVFIDLKFIKD